MREGLLKGNAEEALLDAELRSCALQCLETKKAPRDGGRTKKTAITGHPLGLHEGAPPRKESLGGVERGEVETGESYPPQYQD